jgi:hypothetical protein
MLIRLLFRRIWAWFFEIKPIPHVGGERVDLVDVAGGFDRMIPSPQVKDLELIGVGRLERGRAQVHAPDPMAPLLQKPSQVKADEAAGAGD